MQVIGIILIILTFIAFAAWAYSKARKRYYQHTDHIKVIEPDLDLHDRPDLIRRIPENEDHCPDANAETNDHVFKDMGQRQKKFKM